MHEGHRERLRKRLLRCKIDDAEPHEVLECLLYFVIKRKDTNEIAHKLINKFGSFSSVLEASRSSLERIDGIGKLSSFFLSFIFQVIRYYSLDKIDVDLNKRLTLQEVENLLRSKFIGKKNECVVIILMDKQRRLRYCDVMSEGGFDNVGIDISIIVDKAREYDSNSVILAHNHPSGFVLPSRQDVLSTAKIKETLMSLHIRLLDHFIEANGDILSLALSDLGKSSGLKPCW